MVHGYVRDNVHGLIVYVNLMVKCVCYMGLGFNGCFMASTALTSGHYRTNIIGGVGHEVELSHAASVIYGSL